MVALGNTASDDNDAEQNKVCADTSVGLHVERDKEDAANVKQDNQDIAEEERVVEHGTKCSQAHSMRPATAGLKGKPHCSWCRYTSHACKIIC